MVSPRISVVVAIIALAGPALGESPEPPAQPSPAPTSYTIKAIRAFPWCHGKGKVANQDFLTEQYALSNVPVGAADVECPTDITLLVAEIERPPKDGRKPATLTLTAKSSGRTMAQHSLRLDYQFFPLRTRTVYVPMLVYGTGCEPVAIEAKVTVGKKVVGSMKKTINFRCGE